MTEDELILQIKYKCTLAAARYRSSRKDDMPDDMRAKDRQTFLACRDYALSETVKLTDEFSKGFAEHQVVKMLTVVGEDDLARKFISQIEMDIAREGATADFLSGADACFDKLMGKAEPDLGTTEDDSNSEEQIIGWERFKIKIENVRVAFLGFLLVIAATIIVPIFVVWIGLPALGFEQLEWTPQGVLIGLVIVFAGICYYAYQSFKVYREINDSTGVGRNAQRK